MFITRNHDTEENAIGVTCRSFGVWAVGQIPSYKHFIPAGLTRKKSKSLK